MDIWAEKFLAKLEKFGIPCHLLTKYVDDIVIVTSKCEKGVRYSEGKLVKTPETEAEDETRTEETVTMSLLAEIASSFYDFLQFTHEVAQEGEMIPVLDMQVGISKRESNGPWFSRERVQMTQQRQARNCQQRRLNS